MKGRDDEINFFDHAVDYLLFQSRDRLQDISAMLTSDFDSGPAFLLEACVFGLSAAGSALFLFMIRRRTEPTMQVYQVILMYSCLFDWVLTFTSFFTRPVSVFW